MAATEVGVGGGAREERTKKDAEDEDRGWGVGGAGGMGGRCSGGCPCVSMNF